ncbi:MAG: hypothetical protein WC796_02095 [Candidatus Pacearchaeota archaeon]|jgi:hypothetical protein
MKKPLCDVNCWHYGSFGRVDGCERNTDDYGGWPEPIEPGQKCLYPDDKRICQPVIISLLGLCAMLDGVVIEGGVNDNTHLAQMLVGAESER